MLGKSFTIYQHEGNEGVHHKVEAGLIIWVIWGYFWGVNRVSLSGEKEKPSLEVLSNKGF